MARYGFTLYGLRKYGEVDENKVYYVSGLSGLYTEYGSVRLSWGPIASDPSELPLTHWKLIRSVGGVPDHPNDGLLLDGDVIESFRVSYSDNTIATSGIDSQVCYSIWAYNGQEWIESGSVRYVVVKDLGTQQLMLDLLPAAWSNQVGGVGNVSGETEASSDLGLFLSALAFMKDKLAAETNLVANIYNHLKAPVEILPQAITNMGFGPEPTLGDMHHRSLYRVGHVVNQYKGTKKGLVNYVAGLTHWASTVDAGRNMLNNFDDSSFEHTTGWWTKSHGTLTAESYADPADAPTFTLEDLDSPARRAGYGKIVSATASPCVIRPLGDALLYGTPVEPDIEYGWKGYFQTASGTTTATLSIDWYDFKGLYVDSSDVAVTTIDTDWTLATSTGTAPANALYAQPVITIDDVTTAVHMDMLEFYIVDNADPAQALTFEDARKTRIRLIADRTNLVPNPAFDNGVGGWTGFNSTVTQNFATAGVFGASCAEVKATGSDAAIVSEWIPAASSAPHTFSAYLRGETGNTATLRMEFSHPLTAADQIKVTTDGTKVFYEGGQHIVEETIELVTDSWVRGSVTAVSPEYVSDAGNPLVKLSVIADGSTAGDSLLVDCVLLEQTPTLRDFFQGNGAPAPANAGQSQTIYANDCKWEVKTHYNFVQEPNFDSGWTGATQVSSGTDSVTSLYGIKNGKVTAGSASTVVPVPLIVSGGGRDIVGSVYVYSKTAGTFTISLGSASADFTIGSGQINHWIRLHVKTVAEEATTNYTLSVESTEPFWLNGPQVEVGQVPSSFVDFTSAETVTGTVDGVTYRAARETNQFGARSFYWTRYIQRYLRLADNLPSQVALGADWVIVSGEETPAPSDSDSSLIKSSSFESGINGWNTLNSTIKREVALGSLFGSTALHGGAWALVTKSSSGTYGIETDLVEIRPFAGHYIAAAIKPTDASSYANYTIRVDWLDDFGDPLIVDGTAHYSETTVDVDYHDEWAYLMVTSPSKTAAYGKVSITADAGNSFAVDHVLFRE